MSDTSVVHVIEEKDDAYKIDINDPCSAAEDLDNQIEAGSVLDLQLWYDSVLPQ